MRNPAPIPEHGWFTGVIILLAALLAVYAQSRLALTRGLAGVQVDFLPVLMVYTALTAGPLTIAMLAVCAGLWFDSLSANPLGLSILPLLAVGLLIYRKHSVILRREWVAQMVLGLGASVAVPAMAVLLLLALGEVSEANWSLLGQLLFLGISGAALTPLCFMFLDRVRQAFEAAPAPGLGFRPEREIKRGPFPSC